jgi:hypothetical protein
MSATHFTGPVVSSNGFSGSAVAAAAGAGSGTLGSSDISKVGKIINTQFFVDLTGQSSTTTLVDIIGITGTDPAYFGIVDNAKMGQVYAMTMTCLKAPVTGATDIDLFAATEATGPAGANESTLTAVVQVASTAAWTLNRVLTAAAWPADGDSLYLMNGTSGTIGTYTAGQFVIELWGYEA